MIYTNLVSVLLYYYKVQKYEKNNIDNYPIEECNPHIGLHSLTVSDPEQLKPLCGFKQGG